MNSYTENLRRSIINTTRRVTEMFDELREKQAVAHRDEIIRMARECGLTDPHLGECVTDYGDATEAVQRFFRAAFAAGAAAERAACAKVCEEWAASGAEYSLLDAIRARGAND